MGAAREAFLLATRPICPRYKFGGSMSVSRVPLSRSARTVSPVPEATCGFYPNCDAGHATGAQSDVETYMSRPRQEAGAGAPSCREREYVKICTRFPPGRRAMQAEPFVCAVACSGFLGRKLGQEDPRTGTQEAQEPGLTGSLNQWRSGGRRP